MSKPKMKGDELVSLAREAFDIPVSRGQLNLFA